jgi:hypothetical protein
VSTGAGVKRNGGGARSLRVGPAEERSKWKARGRRRSGVKMAKLPRSPIYKHGAEILGAEVVFHYGDRNCTKVPRVSMMWGGGLNNRATRQVMAVMAGNDHTANRHLM